MTRTYRAPRTFDPTYSLLGRLLRAWTGDRLRGEALYLLTVTGLTLALLLAHYLGWALLQTLAAADPTGGWQTLFWAGQGGSVLVLVGLGGIGFRPGVTVTVRRDAGVLHLQQGKKKRHLSLEAVGAVSRIAARRYHRHERRYAATDVFASCIGDEVLRLDHAQGVIVIGLPSEDDLNALHATLTSADDREPVVAADS